MQANNSPAFDQVRSAVTTAVAAKALNRKPQTLRTWACTGTGPLHPVRIHGRLAWPVDQIAALLNGGANV
jgi:hypothetical protein